MTCTERTCSNLGSDIGTCGNNTVCVDVSVGIRCDCESDAFNGSSVWNGEATCTEKTCDDASCPRGSTCEDTNVQGYVCRCDDGYVPDEAENGAPLTCIRRTCSNPGFSPVNTCGNHSTCAETDDGVACSCEGAFEGTTVMNAPASCTEKACAGDGSTCGNGASCFNRDVNDGYECVCDDAYHPDSVWNLSLIHI